MLSDVKSQRKIRIRKIVGENVGIVGDLVDFGKGNIHEAAVRESLEITLKLFRDLGGAGAGLGL